MSYDISARCQHCGTTLADWSPTYNFADMFSALGIYPRDWHGKPAREYAEALGAAHAALLADPAKYAVHDAHNGWGTAAQLIEQGTLKEMAEAFGRAGDALVDAT